MPRPGIACAAWLLIVAGTGAHAQVRDSGSGEVAVTSRLTVTIPSLVELRLDATEITFDLDAESLQTEELACVHGSGGGDATGETVAALDHQTTVLPLGTGFRHGTYPTVTVEGAGPVQAYPPVRFDAYGEAVAGSDRDFVCYRTFRLRRFVNVDGWHLTVERPAEGESRGLGPIYVRDGGCTAATGLQGLFPLYAGQRRLLAHADTSEPCPDGDVIVLAVKAGAVPAGEIRTRLVYTLMTPAFEPTP